MAPKLIDCYSLVIAEDDIVPIPFDEADEPMELDYNDGIDPNTTEELDIYPDGCCKLCQPDECRWK